MTGASRPSVRVGKRALAAFAAGSIAVPLSFGLMGGTAFAAAQGSSTPPAPTAIDGVCPPGQVPDSNFPDTQNDFFKDAINCLVAYGVTQGYPDGNYKPSLAVNREQMALFFFRVGKAAGANWNTSDAGFTDINTASSQEAKDAINALANAKIIQGFTDNTYRPAVVVHRDAMAKFIANTVKFLGGPDLTTSTNDYYTDDAGDIFESFINGITDGKISNGTGSHSYGPGLSVARDAMAGFISRSMEVLYDAGKLKTQFPTQPPSNQTYTVSPSTTQTQVVGNVVTYTVSNLGTSPVDIALYGCNQVSMSNGSATFAGSSNPGSASGNAAPAPSGGTSGAAVVSQVNGQTSGGTIGTKQANGITPSNGSITFQVTDANPDCVTPVVFQQGAGANANTLFLNASNQPAVPYGVGGNAQFVPAQANAGAFGGGGTSVPTDSVIAPGPTSTYFVTSNGSYNYKSSDNYQLYNAATLSCQTSTYAAFQQMLTRGDKVGGFYAPTGASTFCLDDIAPPPPTNVSAAAGGATTGGVTVTWTNTTGTEAANQIASYTIFRAPATAPTVTNAPYTCPAAYTLPPGTSPQNPPTSPYTAVATVPAQPTASQQSTTYKYTGGNYTYVDTAATAGSGTTANVYCYAVSSVSPNVVSGTQTGTAQPANSSSSPANTSGTAAGANPAPVKGSNQAATTTPAFDSASVTGPNTVKVVYNQPITCSTVDAGDFSVSVTHSGVTTTANAANAGGCANTATTINQSPNSANNGTVSITTSQTIQPGDTVLITAQKSTTDNDTVCNTAGGTLSSPTNCQAVGNQVQATASTAAVSPAVQSASATDSTHVAVVFSQNVCRNAAWAAGDWTVTDTTTAANSVTPTGDNAVLCTANNNGTSTVTITTPAMTGGDNYTVALTATGAPKFQNPVGTTAQASSATFTA